jgi:hypothetical protein
VSPLTGRKAHPDPGKGELQPGKSCEVEIKQRRKITIQKIFSTQAAQIGQLFYLSMVQSIIL